MNRMLDKIRRSAFFSNIMKLLAKVGLNKPVLQVMYKWLEKHPTQTVLNSYKYFSEHQDDIDRIANYFEDDKSIVIWKQLIEFRKTMNYKYHPGGGVEDQYFEPGIVDLKDNEIFLDCGAYDGATTLTFFQRMEDNKKEGGESIVFEPDRKCLDMIRDNIPSNNKVTFIPKGVWNKNCTIGFSSTGDMISHIVESTEDGLADNIETIEVVSIDTCTECRNATFIKMDLEGAEQKALEGARETIIKNKPKLAISIYYTDEDMINIIDYIHNLIHEYKLYVRHYLTAYFDTVLYAVL